MDKLTSKVYSEQQLLKIHEVEIQILSEVIRICEANDISYFAAFGTALGAVRHNGFIPWDDDIDIGMLRDDYDKFIKIAPQYLKAGYSLQHFSVDKNTPNYFAKVRKDNSTFLEKQLEHLPINHGIFVDIMPFDALPNDVSKRKKYRFFSRTFHRLYILKFVTPKLKGIFDKKRIISNFVKRIIKLVICPIKAEVLFNKLDNIVSKYNGDNIVSVAFMGEFSSEVEFLDIFPLKLVKFENIQINIPNNYDKILKKQYGNYMKLPPIDKRIGHAPLILDFDKPYIVCDKRKVK